MGFYFLRTKIEMKKNGRKEETREWYEKTLPLFERLLEGKPTASVARLSFARVLIETGQIKRAKKNLKRIINQEAEENPVTGQAIKLMKWIEKHEK